MPIDVDRVIAGVFPATSYSWSDRDVILYHLGIGAGNPPTDERELRYVYEGDLQVLPAFATIPPFSTMMSLGMIDGLEINLTQILHGEHDIVVHRPIPTEGSVSQDARVTGVYDKGKGALITMEIVSIDMKTNEPLFTNRPSIFVRGEGGFGGESGPGERDAPPDREPDIVVEYETLPQQALLYRMSSGDLNPLHADPGFAMFAGFERPILHGLCTYGIALKAAVDAALDGDTTSVTGYSARFAGVVYPGETVSTRIWEQGNGLVLSASVESRNATVLSNSRVTVG
ncbi:MAG TPA: MaoC/PaaZ C-terminal domain-containing protein [Acidimicrobiia bacterium]